MSISLPEPMKRWLESQARSGRYRDESEVLRDLIRREQERSDRVAAMQRLVDEARTGGACDESMAEVRERALRTASARR